MSEAYDSIAAAQQMESDPVAISLFETVAATMDAQGRDFAEALSDAKTPFLGVLDLARDMVADNPELADMIAHMEQDYPGLIRNQEQESVVNELGGLGLNDDEMGDLSHLPTDIEAEIPEPTLSAVLMEGVDELSAEPQIYAQEPAEMPVENLLFEASTEPDSPAVHNAEINESELPLHIVANTVAGSPERAEAVVLHNCMQSGSFDGLCEGVMLNGKGLNQNDIQLASVPMDITAEALTRGRE